MHATPGQSCFGIFCSQRLIILESQNYKQRIIKAGAWVLTGRLSNQLIRLISNLILTRLLVPEMFGLMSFIGVLMAGLTLFTDFGLGQNITQSKRSTEQVFLNTVWSVKVLRGLFIWGVSILLALLVLILQHYQLMPVGTVYAENLLPWIIPVATFTTVIDGFEPTWTAMLSRNLEQKRLVKLNLICQLIGIVAMVVIAYHYRTIWALVIGSLVSSLVRSLVVNVLIKEQRNKFEFEDASLTEIFKFGKWVFLSSITSFLGSNCDKLLLAGLLTSTQMGVFSIASVMTSAIVAIMLGVLGAVAYPALSEIVREKPYDLKRVYYRFRIPFDASLLFIAGFFMMSGQAFIHILYDDRYQDAGWMFSVLALCLVALRYHLVDHCFVALAKPKIMATLNLVRTIATFVILPIGNYLYGIKGAIWAVALTNFASFPWAIYYKKQHGLLDVKKELMTLPIFFVGLICGYLFNQLATFFSR